MTDTALTMKIQTLQHLCVVFRGFTAYIKLYWAVILFILSLQSPFNISSHLRLGHPRGLFPSYSRAKMLNELAISKTV
jgi:hypothetical protein